MCEVEVKCGTFTGVDQRFSNGGAPTSAEGMSFLGGLGACPPPLPPDIFENLSL